MTSYTVATVSLIVRTFMNEETKAEINLYNITFSGLPLECPSLAYVFPFIFFLFPSFFHKTILLWLMGVFLTKKGIHITPLFCWKTRSSLLSLGSGYTNITMFLSKSPFCHLSLCQILIVSKINKQGTWSAIRFQALRCVGKVQCLLFLDLLVLTLLLWFQIS